MKFPRTVIAAFLLLFALGAATGCSKKPAQETPPDAQPRIGIIDMQKAIQAHPQYQQVVALQKELNTLQEEYAALQNPAPAIASGTASPVSNGSGDAFQQEFQSKMSAKQAELNQNLSAKAAQAKASLDEDMKAYAAELDKEYQPRIFNQQLKMKTVKMTKEEMDTAQAELDRLQTEQKDKLSAKQQELSKRLDEQMQPAQQAAQQQLAAYQQQVNAELAARQQAAAAESAARQAALPTPAASQPTQKLGEKQQALSAKQQEIGALQDAIIRDIQDKTAKIAIEQSLDTVLTSIQLNVSAVDITSAVIAEFKK